MINTLQIYELINSLAPFSLSEGYDNVGVIYDDGRATNRILFALDITRQTIGEAAELGCGILVSHHPVMFGGVDKIKKEDPVALAIQKGISLVSAHTNYDRVEGGTSDVLAGLLGITVTGEVQEGLGRIGHLKGICSPTLLLERIKKVLAVDALEAVIGERDISKVVVVAGSGGDLENILEMDIDAVITGECRYHHAIKAKQNGVTLVIAGHFATENQGFQELQKRVEKLIESEVECIYSKVGQSPTEFY